MHIRSGQVRRSFSYKVNTLLENYGFEGDPNIGNPAPQIKCTFYGAGPNELLFNDEYLMKLVLEQPIMYDSTRLFYGDKRLIPYAWRHITAKFNQKYHEHNMNVTFTVAQVKDRWQHLCPLIRQAGLPKYRNFIYQPARRYIESLNDAYFAHFMPDDGRGTVRTTFKRDIEDVRRLDSEQKKQLQMELVERITRFERDVLGVSLTAERLKRIQDECQHVFDLIQ